MKVEAKQQVSESELDRFIAGRCMSFVGNPRITLKLWNGNEYSFADGSPVGRLVIRERKALLQLFKSPSIAFGEAYTNGLVWQVAQAHPMGFSAFTLVRVAARSLSSGGSWSSITMSMW